MVKILFSVIRVKDLVDVLDGSDGMVTVDYNDNFIAKIVVGEQKTDDNNRLFLLTYFGIEIYVNILALY